jgi:GTP-binding protein EngB required for normal cell division
MSRVSGDIAERSRQLAAVAAAYPALAARADRLAERVDAQRFHVAVVGAFKRGKSTVINALLDRPVLPTGVLPLTAIATEVSYGSSGATIVGLDGTRTTISLDGLARYVTEAGNPDNMLGVARAEVHVDCPLLASGLVLVDTPGLGSVHGHDADTQRAVDQSDAAIVVLAADMALADDEQQLLTEFGRRNAKIFVVVNKADHVDPSDRQTVLDYVTAACAPDVPVWAISARAAVDNSGDPGAFDAFRAAIDRFVHDDLAGARDAAVTNELRDIATHVAERCQLEAAAASLDAQQLSEIAARFRSLAAAERDTFAGDQLLLADRCKSLVHDLSARLTARVRTASVGHVDELNSAANGPLNRMDERLDDAIDAAVRTELAAWQTDETETIDHAWTGIATNAQRRAAERIATVRRAAADMFAIELPHVAVPSVTDEPDTFWFLLTPPVSMSDPYIHLGRAVQPAALRRRRSLHRATSRLTEELDKHAGRLRHALEERLDTARTRFTNAATAALDDAINGINEAIAAAERAGGIDADAADAARRRATHALELAGG